MASSSAVVPSPPPRSPSAIVCGAGAIGACTAYFLAQKGVRVTIVEKSSVACAASGKAGGFLALDWCDDGPVGKLARASFLLHQQLAESLQGEARYGYRPLETLSVQMTELESSGNKGRGCFFPALPGWVDGPAQRCSSIGGKRNTAQVHPKLFTEAVVSAAVERFGAEVRIGEAEEVRVCDGHVVGAVVDGVLVPAETVVLAMGPWSVKNALISSLTTISGLKAHSIVVQPRDPDSVSAHALFLNYRTREGKDFEPEVYPRPTGEVYICGMTEEVELPDDPAAIMPREESIAMLRRMAGVVSSQLGEADVKAEQACFLPCSEDGVPLIGQIPGIKGAYVATGHSCWGILNAPATGASLAELIVDGHSELVDLKPFDPARFSGATRSRMSSV